VSEVAVWNALQGFIPQLVLIAFAILLPGLDYLLKKDKRPLAWFTLVPLVAIAAYIVTKLFFSSEPLRMDVGSLLTLDTFSGLFMLVFISVGIVIVLASPEFIRKDRNHGEYYALVLLALTGMTVVAESNDLIALFVGLEIAGISSFALSGFRKSEDRSAEAATKYFIIGGFSSALTLFAISLIYGIAGTTSIEAIGQVLADPTATLEGSRSVVLLAVVLFIAGLGFKIALVPFHMWAPDVYEGAPTPISGLLAAASKKMGFAAIFKIFLIAVIVTKTDWQVAIAALAIISMTVGNLIAISQTNMKRMLAYSSIAQAGYILIVLPVGTQYALEGGLFHILTHAFMKSGAFMVVAAMGAVALGEKLEDFKGLSKRSPFLSFSMAIFLLSLAGIPPLAGFSSKFVLFSSAVYASESGPQWLVWLAIAGVLNSALSLYYYARVIKYMYMDPGPGDRISVTPMIGVSIALALIMVVAIGLYPQAVIDICKSAAAGAFPSLPPGLP
jgi:proton-translocating NADH-quinone oxidoreductase chain N